MKLVFTKRAGSKVWPAFLPFFVALGLVVMLMLYRFTGIGPNSNIYALCALAAIVLGLVVGVVALLLEKTILVRWRLLIGLLYLPTAVCSLLLAGF